MAGHDEHNPPADVLRLVRGDDCVGAPGLSRRDLVKIDVEGFEPQVLAGLRETLERFRPAVMMELPATTRAFLDGPEAPSAMLPHGYRVSQLHPNRPLPGIFNLPSVRLEAFDFGAVDGNIFLRPA